MKDSFILKTSWIGVFEDLNDRQAGVLIKAVFNYIATGEKPELTDSEIKMAFKFIMLDLDNFSRSYEKRCQTNRENGMKGAEYGKLGGRPRSDLKTPKTPNGDTITPKTPDNENENDLNPPSIPPKGDGEDDEKFDFNSLSPPNDGKNRNFRGLLEQLDRHSIPERDRKRIILASDYGMIGHQVWGLFAEIQKGGIKMPVKFILSRLGL